MSFYHFVIMVGKMLTEMLTIFSGIKKQVLKIVIF